METQDRKQVLLQALERTVSNQIRAEQQGDMLMARFYADIARELREELTQNYGITWAAGQSNGQEPVKNYEPATQN